MSWVKICGVTSEEDALLAAAMGADAVGFVFAPSRRQITAARARDIRKRMPRDVATIGVFKGETKEQVVRVWAEVGLHGVQLHGAVPAADVRWIRERVPFVVRAYAAGDPSLARAGDDPIDAVLVDSPDPGSGKVFDWTLAEGAPAGVLLILAGGLTPDNVEGAIARVRPWGVDVATGVESAPGVKDERKVRRFVANARQGFRALGPGRHDPPGPGLARDADLDALLGLDLTGAGDEYDDDAPRPYDWSIDGD